mmetsp:Transcript_2756/g.8863  ORF Transcript_2756/g.8863 Transcript_2756/m.8863 type:complete len:332 (-) Transcript_2756:1244-2239(-)
MMRTRTAARAASFFAASPVTVPGEVGAPPPTNAALAWTPFVAAFSSSVSFNFASARAAASSLRRRRAASAAFRVLRRSAPESAACFRSREAQSSALRHAVASSADSATSSMAGGDPSPPDAKDVDALAAAPSSPTPPPPTGATAKRGLNSAASALDVESLVDKPRDLRLRRDLPLRRVPTIRRIVASVSLTRTVYGRRFTANLALRSASTSAACDDSNQYSVRDRWSTTANFFLVEPVTASHVSQPDLIRGVRIAVTHSGHRYLGGASADSITLCLGDRRSHSSHRSGLSPAAPPVSVRRRRAREPETREPAETDFDARDPLAATEPLRCM